jgi:hypothetical protein
VQCRVAIAREGSGSCLVSSSNCYGSPFYTHTHTTIQAACFISHSNSYPVLVPGVSHKQLSMSGTSAQLTTGECSWEGILLVGSSYSVGLTGVDGMQADATDSVMIGTDQRSVVEYAATFYILPVRLYRRYYCKNDNRSRVRYGRAVKQWDEGPRATSAEHPSNYLCGLLRLLHPCCANLSWQPLSRTQAPPSQWHPLDILI